MSTAKTVEIALQHTKYLHAPRYAELEETWFEYPSITWAKEAYTVEACMCDSFPLHPGRECVCVTCRGGACAYEV